MGQRFKQITYPDRIAICHLRAGVSKDKIAEQLGFHRSSIYREVARNSNTPIADRPMEINQRKTIGHWEGDLMLFGKSTQTNLITLRERYSRYMIAVKNPNRQAEGTAERIIEKLSGLLKDRVKTITFDNGSEFYKHDKIANKLNAKTYFCDPYKSYQKGTIEKRNIL